LTHTRIPARPGKLAPRLRRGPSPARFAAVAVLGLLPVLGGARLAAAQDSDPEGTYAFEVWLAPVCLDGTFPLSIETEDGPVTGDATLTTDVAGKVTGTVKLLGVDYEITGKAKYRNSGHSVKLKLKNGRTRINAKLTYVLGSFSGTAVGNKGLTKGKNPATLDASGADPQVARIEATLAPFKGKKYFGDGTLRVCGPELPITAKAVHGKKFKLSLKGSKFRWSGKAATAFSAGVPLAWKTKGYGASVSGAGLAFEALDPPFPLSYRTTTAAYEAEETILPNTVTSAIAPQVTFTVNPALPGGLTLDPWNGTISGAAALPAGQTVYEVTQTNRAGISSEQLTLTVTPNRAYSLAAHADVLTDEEAAHLLERTHFGVRQVELDAVAAKGLARFLDDMLVFQQGTAAEADAFQQLQNDDDPAGFEGKFPSTNDVARWWQLLMMRSDQPFQEALAFFWHDHFAASTAVLGGGNRYYMVDYVNLLRREGAGNCRDLLLSISRDPAMLVYLDGILNRRGGPNENYAREFWELFSLGRDNGYTEADIVESARAFTGWRQRFDADTDLNFMEFDTGRHDAQDKLIFGQYLIAGQNDRDDYEEMVRLTLEHRDVAEYLVEKMFAWFVFDDPSDEVVDQLARILRDNDYELAPVLKTIFQSEAFFSPRARGAQVKSPVDFTIGFIRATGLEISVSTLDGNLNDLGQRPTRPPVVDGWTHGTLWFSAQAMVERANHVDDAIDSRSYQSGLGIDVADVLPPVAERTADAVVDRLAARMRVDLSTGDRADLIDYLNTERQNDGTVQSDPFDGSDQSHLDGRVRGVIWVLSQHPTYHTR